MPRYPQYRPATSTVRPRTEKEIRQEEESELKPRFFDLLDRLEIVKYYDEHPVELRKELLLTESDPIDSALCIRQVLGGVAQYFGPVEYRVLRDTIALIERGWSWFDETETEHPNRPLARLREWWNQTDEKGRTNGERLKSWSREQTLIPLTDLLSADFPIISLIDFDETWLGSLLEDTYRSRVCHEFGRIQEAAISEERLKNTFKPLYRWKMYAQKYIKLHDALGIEIPSKDKTFLDKLNALDIANAPVERKEL